MNSTDARQQLASIVAAAKNHVDALRKRVPGARVLSSTPMKSSATVREAELLKALDKAPPRIEIRPEAVHSVKVLFVSEALITDESPAGKLLAKIIQAMGLARTDAAVSSPSAMDSAVSRLKPRVLVALGEATTRVLLSNDAEFGKLRGRFADYKGTPLMPTHHPAELLKNDALKRHVWDDMKLVAAKSTQTGG